jgi:hypothetical protein
MHKKNVIKLNIGRMQRRIGRQSLLSLLQMMSESPKKNARKGLKATVDLRAKGESA